jgi:hypothetical protein
MYQFYVLCIISDVRSFILITFRSSSRNNMTSVLNVGVMRGNPVGNQIRFLQMQLDSEKKNMQMLLTAMQTKAPEVLAEYVRLKEEESAASAPAVQQGQNNRFQQQPQFQSSQPVARNPNGRF